MAKYAARFALAFSTSVPVCRVLPENVCRVPDIGTDHSLTAALRTESFHLQNDTPVREKLPPT